MPTVGFITLMLERLKTLRIALQSDHIIVRVAQDPKIKAPMSHSAPEYMTTRLTQVMHGVKNFFD